MAGTTKTDSITAPDAMDTKLPQTVEITDNGPCRKHVKVTIAEDAVKARFDEKFTDLVLNSKSSLIPGFRAGKAPRKIIEKKYRPEVKSEIKQELLMASLEQLADEQQISPLAPPELDPGTIVVPDEGPFIYEFNIEVRPEFDLPNYKGLKIRRPMHVFTDADVEKAGKKFLEPHGKLVAKPAPATVALNDVITADVTIRREGADLNTIKDVKVKVEKQLALADGLATKFSDEISGAKVGEGKEVTITLSQDLGNEALRGTAITAFFAIKEIQSIEIPALTPDMLAQFGVRSEEQFHELIRSKLERQLDYMQRQTARNEVFKTLAANTNWELPNDLLRRQARRTLSRRVMEMRQSGMTDEQINGRAKALQNDALKSTADALKEHFVLQKIAEVEKIEIEDVDIDGEIERLADQTGESYRKVRARLEKEDMIEAVATELLERKALDLVLENATYEDYEMNPMDDKEGDVSSVGTSVAPEDTATS